MKKKPRNLKEALKNKLTKKELNQLITSFDSIGNIAVIQVPDELKRKEKLIGNTLLKLNKQFKTVCKVVSPRKGKYRVQELKSIAGEKNFIAEYN